MDTIPPELLSHIFSFIPVSHLTTVQLVSHSFESVATPLLWRNVTVTHPKECTGGPNAQQHFEILRFLSSEGTGRRIAGHVRSIRLDCKSEEEFMGEANPRGYSVRRFNEDLESAVTVCRGLERFYFRSTCDTILPTTFSTITNAPRLKELVIKRQCANNSYETYNIIRLGVGYNLPTNNKLVKLALTFDARFPNTDAIGSTLANCSHLKHLHLAAIRHDDEPTMLREICNAYARTSFVRLKLESLGLGEGMFLVREYYNYVGNMFDVSHLLKLSICQKRPTHRIHGPSEDWTPFLGACNLKELKFEAHWIPAAAKVFLIRGGYINTLSKLNVKNSHSAALFEFFNGYLIHPSSSITYFEFGEFGWLHYSLEEDGLGLLYQRLPMLTELVLKVMDERYIDEGSVYVPTESAIGSLSRLRYLETLSLLCPTCPARATDLCTELVRQISGSSDEASSRFPSLQKVKTDKIVLRVVKPNPEPGVESTRFLQFD